MGYGLLQTYGLLRKFSTHQVGGLKKVWDMKVSGLSQASVIRGSTVHISIHGLYFNMLYLGKLTSEQTNESM